MKIIRKLAPALALLLPTCLWAQSSPVDDAFFPHSDQSLITVGTQIDATSVEKYRHLIPESLQQHIAAGDYQFTVGPQLTFPVQSEYMIRTLENAGATALGERPGQLNGYQGGRPFLSINQQDPDAGIKTAWNMRYTYSPDETETQRFIWRYQDMVTDRVERTLEMYGALLRYQHRYTHQPIPALEDNPSDLYSAMYLRAKSPQDIRNTQLLIHRAEDDTVAEQAWIYFNTQRRVKRIATGQKTDAFLGSDIMIEDFLGYNGRVMDMIWTYQGSQDMLLPYYAHNELYTPTETPSGSDQATHYKAVTFTGKGHCYPHVTWQLRRVHRLKAEPKDSNHPLSKREYLIDAATFTPALVEIYDRAGKLWKLSIAGYTHSDHQMPENVAWQGAIAEAVSMIDVQAQHCTTLELKTHLAQSPLTHSSFNTSYLRRMGR